jgi:hypothetical protein
MTALDDYLASVRALVASVSPLLTPAELRDVEHLIDHDEIGEALRTLAWIIVEEEKRVPASTPSAIRRLSAGLVDPADLPADLDGHSAPDL